ncbi:Cthe_2314 family HEPN domain-containing protein [Pedobacter cryoconitis]|uniref:Cthe-2314-like HEPN domain-containing protein n=1 Tax=Pedobacter cryoconitis TaxID=188932 RepID=A0A7X0J5H6_9SPHI|nr:Cthe_2314 family HEPN domain-containing protein [Pedobacter cryoconitis]MBB6501225.1 hypothetical protein [Pedobacter cryoconitis]
MDIQSYLDHTDQLFEVYKKLKLVSIDDYYEETSSRWNDKNFISYFTDVTRSKNTLNSFDTSDFKMYDDFVMLSGDIKFCAGMLHYLFPYTTKEPKDFTSSIIDRRYIMHVSFGYQSIYQFWDRIGDFLWIYFFTGIEAKKVYTGGVLKNLPEIYKNCEPYLQLKKSYESFNYTFRMRHDIVHNCSMGTELFWERNKYYTNEKKLNKLLSKVQGYRDKITKSLPQCIEALFCALELIQQLPNKTIEINT